MSNVDEVKLFVAAYLRSFSGQFSIDRQVLSLDFKFSLSPNMRPPLVLLSFEVCVSTDFPWELGNTDMETKR